MHSTDQLHPRPPPGSHLPPLPPNAPFLLVVDEQMVEKILKLLAKGYLHKEIAEELKIAFSTVRNLTARIYRKLHVHSRAQAVAKYHGELS